MAGLFVTFEGIEHCGKSTQSELLAEHLRLLGRKVTLTREPGGTPLGKTIRELVLHSNHDVATLSELLLFAADRAQHVEQLIRPALAAGEIVISDRFADSTRAYQGFGRGISTELIDRTIALATTGLDPHLTILMDIDVATSRERGDDTTDRIEQDTDEFFERVRQGFLTIAAETSQRTNVIDGTLPIETVSGHIREIIDTYLND